MDEFQKDVYNFIFQLFESKNVMEKCQKTIEKLGNRFFDEKAAIKYHQAYEGGLADHTALVTLDAYHSAYTKKWSKINVDDALVVGLFHDIDKIGKYDGNPLCKDDIEVVNYIQERELLNPTIQDGLILIHGGWSNCKGVEHPAIAVYCHAADMLGSHVTKTDMDTRKKIVMLMGEIAALKIVGLKIEESCFFCNGKVLQRVATSKTIPVNSTNFECLTCKTIYIVDHEKTIVGVKKHEMECKRDDNSC